MEAARPTQTVDTFGRMCRIVSKTAIPTQKSLFGHHHYDHCAHFFCAFHRQPVKEMPLLKVILKSVSCFRHYGRRHAPASFCLQYTQAAATIQHLPCMRFTVCC